MRRKSFWNIKKIPVLILGSIGILTLALLIMINPSKPAMAQEPTPTPVATPDTSASGAGSTLLCQLELGKNCTFPGPADIAVSDSKPRTNPSMGARDVPTYTLISATFDRNIEADTITTDTFYVSQGSARIDGDINYIDVSKMAVFSPAAPLTPATTYTATITTGVRDLSGVPLAEARVWTFTTSPAEGSPSEGLTLAEVSTSGSMNIYFGDLHNHTGYSDGQGTPADAYATARASGLDFFALSEHAFMLNSGEWQDILNQADAATVDGVFIGLPGFEFTHLNGHINVFDAGNYVHRDDPLYADLEDFYAWLVAHSTAAGQFNHPIAPNWNFNSFYFNAAADQKMILQELTTADQFFLSMNSGWHLGTLKNRDHHGTNWGCCPFMGLIAPNLTKDAILAALKARRTFFVSPSDSNLAVVMQANGYWMGSAIPETNTLNFTITVSDPDPTGASLRMFLYDKGVPVASKVFPGAALYNWTPTVSGALGHYYYAEAYYNGWLYPAYSSPIWVERPPVAEAGVWQAIAPGGSVTLNGGKSWDPDGDALAYHWTQESGSAVSLSKSNLVQSTFTSPVTLGNLTFRLTVTDTGSLSDFDTATVMVTDKPILSIVKSGPTTTDPDEPITYTLTVTNNGITGASGVVITDAIPANATHISGGTLISGNIVSWTVPSLAANGGVTQTTFVITATGSVLNNDYRASCAGCIPATGSVAILTNPDKIYLPVIQKGYRDFPQ